MSFFNHVFPQCAFKRDQQSNKLQIIYNSTRWVNILPIFCYILANDELKKFFARCRDSNIRLIKISIIDGRVVFSFCFLFHNYLSFLEQLSLDGYENVKENWEKDYDATIGPLIEDDQPCYILYR